MQLWFKTALNKVTSRLHANDLEIGPKLGDPADRIWGTKKPGPIQASQFTSPEELAKAEPEMEMTSVNWDAPVQEPKGPTPFGQSGGASSVARWWCQHHQWPAEERCPQGQRHASAQN